MKNKYLTLLAASSFAFFMQACGDDSSSSSAALDEEKPAEESATAGQLFVVGSDYESGEIRWIEDGKLSKKSISIHQDTKLVYAGSKLFALERYGSDNLALINTEDKKVEWEVSLGDGANPADIVAINDNEAWVGMAGTPEIVKVSMKDGKTVKTIKTDAFMTEDAYSPNLADLDVTGDTLLAIFQRYVTDENWNTVYPKGLLAMYNLKDGKLLDTIQLAKQNPQAIAVVDGNVYVSSMGEYNDSWGTDADDKRGIEKVNLAKKTSELYVSGKKIGAGVYQFAVDYKANVAYATAYGDGEYPVVKIDLASGDVEQIKGLDNGLGGLAVDEATGVLYVGDRSFMEPGVRSYDGKKAALIENSDSKTLDPYSLAVVK